MNVTPPSDCCVNTSNKGLLLVTFVAFAPQDTNKNNKQKTIFSLGYFNFIQRVIPFD
jgi:hypothetical protein